jgi:CHAD domain-containing protein
VSFEVGAGEPFGPGLRRILLEQAGGAAERLEVASGPDLDEAVHEARKGLKKCRAVLRLARPSIGALFGEANTQLRDIGRSLSDVRDARVLGSALEGLVSERSSHEGLEGAGAVVRFLRDRSDRMFAEAVAGGLPQRAAGRIRRTAALIGRGPWDAEGWEFVAEGFQREYRRGRASFGAARRGRRTDDVHEWRKRVKDHWYHLRLLRAGWPPVLKATAKAAHSLSDLLGDEHDLAVLQDTLRESEGTLWGPDTVRSLMAAAGRRRDELFAEAEPLGRRLFAEKPGRFGKRVQRYWKATRSEQADRKHPAA